MTSRPAAGPRNAITDVAGVLVGRHERLGDGWATGVSVVLVPDGAVAAVDQRGGAPGTRETDLLEPSNMVQRVHAVCLAGGSAYGLAAADGVMRWLGERSIGFPVGTQPHEVVPIVPAAVLFDLPLGRWGNRPDAEFGYAACESAFAVGPGAEVGVGCVGAGAGARAGSLKGGLGTASVVVAAGGRPVVVGALVAVNPLGEVVDPETGRPWAADAELAGEFGIRVPGRPGVWPSAEQTTLNTTIGVVAVDAALTKAECRRIAVCAQDGLARSIRPAHSMFDGDTVFALATGRAPLGAADAALGDTGQPGAAGQAPGDPGRAAALDVVCAAAAEVFARAVVRGVLAAHQVGGLPAYRDVWPEAMA
jgi:L-aminopeptidase/D-esterase-like protein